MSFHELVKSRPSQGIFEGALNVNIILPGLILGGIKRQILRRFPKEDKSVIQSIANEYNAIGFTQAGGSFRRRTPYEQVQFANQASELGLRVLKPLHHEGLQIENLFLEGARTMDVFLAKATAKQTDQFIGHMFSDLYLAHRSGTIYGDRWSENTLIVPGIGIVHIDFDIEILGPPAKDFEASQVAYYILAGAKAKAIPQLAQLLSIPNANLDMKNVETFLRGHAEHFDTNEKYGNLKTEVGILIEHIYEKYESHRRSK
ncbi:hypothetical protein HZA75_01770 [Candidatus Roizmanbacteria bacterium]|nr:hypothetical protein [Candidatus Roizmanbacteria bacterium]